MFGAASPRTRSISVSSVPDATELNDDSAMATSAAPAFSQLYSVSDVDALRREFNEKIIKFEEHIKFLMSENQVLRNQLLAATVPSDSEASISSANRRSRKIAKKAVPASEMLSDDIECVNDEQFPSLPPVSNEAGNNLPKTLNNNNNVNNRFALLADNSINNNSRINIISANSSAGGRAKSNNNTQSRKKVLQAIDTGLFKVRQQLAEANISSFSVKQTTKNGPVKIVIADEKEVPTAKEALANAKVSYHEFKWTDEKQKCFIIRGLVGATEEDLPDIHNELLQAGLPSEISVSLHHTGYMRANPNVQHDPPVKLVVPPNFDDKALLNIKFLNHIAVRFELFKSKSIVQCKNCQRFGHSAGGCQHEHRCVKCGQNHLRNDCPRTNNAHYKLKCCNCGGEHTANNLNSCSFFIQQYVKKQQPTVKPAPPASARPKFTPSPRQPGVSYAQMAGRIAESGPASNSSPLLNTLDTSIRASNSSTEAKIFNALNDLNDKFNNVYQLFSKHDKILNLIISKLSNV